MRLFLKIFSAAFYVSLCVALTRFTVLIASNSNIGIALIFVLIILLLPISAGWFLYEISRE